MWKTTPVFSQMTETILLCTDIHIIRTSGNTYYKPVIGYYTNRQAKTYLEKYLITWI